MKQVWKRRAVAAAVVVLVGTSVYLNWRYAGNVEETSKVLGQSTLVNGQTTEAQADTSSDGGEDYFSTARLSRKQARDTAISMLEDAKGEENASEEVATQIENLVVAKGYADCVAFMGADSISVVVSAPDGLEAEDVAKIKDIVIAETSYNAGQIKIMEAGTGKGK